MKNPWLNTRDSCPSIRYYTVPKLTVLSSPKSKLYLERNLPPYLQSSLENMISSWKIIDNGGKDYHWDLNWSELNADINSAEVGNEISSEQAWYLRETYLRMKRGE